MNTESVTAPALPILSPLEARILGCLVEKQATTPEAYPLTANAVVVACNQKSNRDPVMEAEPGEVGHALRAMEQRGLIRSDHGARARRYEHRFTQAYTLTPRQVAVLALMLLRGPQTMAELHTRSERLTTFADVDELRQTRDSAKTVTCTCCAGLSMPRSTPSRPRRHRQPGAPPNSRRESPPSKPRWQPCVQPWMRSGDSLLN
jgi:uncharacterized protein YceH (UPF0502 family)